MFFLATDTGAFRWKIKPEASWKGVPYYDGGLKDPIPVRKALEPLFLNRYEAYNETVAFCEELERQGKAIILRPEHPIESMEKDLQKTGLKKGENPYKIKGLKRFILWLSL